MTKYTCRKCKTPLILRWQIFKNNSDHIACWCPKCERTKLFAPKIPENIKLANLQEPIDKHGLLEEIQKKESMKF